MVVLLGDGIQSFWPSIDLITVRLLSFAILTPTLFLPMRKLAITSLIGIIACVALLVTVIANGLSKRTRPGSLWQPMVYMTLKGRLFVCCLLIYILLYFRIPRSFLQTRPTFPSHLA